ncbi:RimJ/RimL family protein N-acetyltransferase [Allocatelliglobosispora scoriae]|uniref:RimJ/RimL family protein N-acetyltransferase n=1 Tax=Allocatelliglobosispora scoriae TaxID=643052 RepID=A0A841C215_9ACTN|nr:GNAT family N-acetyltransferase [Allocatelliglobosispora scoriae]MBB5873359.1 RimJ/RimL family protein N-acetyltransferase [Allocatelliglobosispora scoriae]
MLLPAYPLMTERLTLRPFAAGDLDDLHAFHSRPEVARYLYWEARDREQTREVLAHKTGQTALRAEGDRLVLAVVAGERVIGEVSLAWLSEEHRQGEFGYVFHPDAGGRGLATEAARVVLRLGFEELGLHRIIGRCDPRNEPSWRLLERLGLRREAHFVQNEIFKGEWGDEYHYAMLEDEWRAITSES